MENLLLRTKTINKFKESYNLFHLWRAFDFAAACMATIGIFSSTMDYEVNYSSNRRYNNCEEYHLHVVLFRYVTAISTCMALIFISLRYYFKERWLTNLYVIEELQPSGSQFKHDNKSLKIEMIIEFVILSIFPYPGLNAYIYLPLRHDFQTVETCYTLAEFFYCFMMLRFFLLFRAIANYSIFQDEKARLYCNRYKISANFYFSFKCLLFCYPIKVISTISVISIIFIGLAYRIFERPLDQFSIEYYSNPLTALWLIIETMSTLGYGEYFPYSYPGRSICVIAYFIGAAIFTITIVKLQEVTTLNTNQAIVYENIAKTKTAAVVVRIGLRYMFLTRKKGQAHPICIKLYFDLRNSIKEFKACREEIENNADRTTQNLKSLKDDIEKTKLQTKLCAMELDRFIKQLKRL